MRSPCKNRGFLRLPPRLSAVLPSAEDPTESSKDMLTRNSVFRAKAAAACDFMCVFCASSRSGLREMLIKSAFP